MLPKQIDTREQGNQEQIYALKYRTNSFKHMFGLGIWLSQTVPVSFVQYQVDALCTSISRICLFRIERISAIAICSAKI